MLASYPIDIVVFVRFRLPASCSASSSCPRITGVAYNLLMAGSLIAVIPVLSVAMVAQRKVVEGLTIGALR